MTTDLAELQMLSEEARDEEFAPCIPGDDELARPTWTTVC